MSNIQTNGQGTHGRVWHTDETENIAFSFYVKINDKPERLEGITIDMATIIQKIFEDLYGVKLTIKSPNDLMLNDKKVGGILTQSKVENGITKFYWNWNKYLQNTLFRRYKADCNINKKRNWN